MKTQSSIKNLESSFFFFFICANNHHVIIVVQVKHEINNSQEQMSVRGKDTKLQNKKSLLMKKFYS